MSKRAQQRADTRERIVEAAVEAFAELGFRGASTREIAGRAGANQGLITYHFRTKDELWRAAADCIFGELRASLAERRGSTPSDDPREFARESIREYVRFAAQRPELFRLMIDEGNAEDGRMQWLVDTHLAPIYENFARTQRTISETSDELLAHFYYLIAGAGSLMFAVAPECRRLTGLDPASDAAIERHADLVARLLLP